MSTIFVATPDGRQRELSVTEFEEQWLRQTLGDQAHYWKAGMEGWKPVAEYKAVEKPAAPPAPEPAPMPALRLAETPKPEKPAEKIASLEPILPRREYIPMTFTKEIGALTKILITFIWLHLGMDLFCTVGLVGFLVFGTGESVAQIMVALAAFFGGVGSIVIFIITAIIFLIWVHRAKANCEGFGAVGLGYSPGWAVGWFFVPFANLIKPFDCMKETWQASTSPSNWMGVEPGKIVTAWWTLWILNNVAGTAIGKFDFDAPGEETKALGYMLLAIGAGLSIGLAFVTSKMLWQIYQRQQSLVDNKEPMDISPLGTVAGVPLAMYRQP